MLLQKSSSTSGRVAVHRDWGLYGASVTRSFLAAGEAPPEMPEQAVLYAELSVGPKGEPASPVRALRYVPGGKAGGHSSLLVLGGQDAEQPDVLSMLPLQGPSEEVPFWPCPRLARTAMLAEHAVTQPRVLG